MGLDNRNNPIVNLKDNKTFLRGEISSKNLILEILAKNLAIIKKSVLINTHYDSKSKSYNNKLTNTSEIDFNSVGLKILATTISNRFGKLCKFKNISWRYTNR